MANMSAKAAATADATMSGFSCSKHAPLAAPAPAMVHVLARGFTPININHHIMPPDRQYKA